MIPFPTITTQRFDDLPAYEQEKFKRIVMARIKVGNLWDNEWKYIFRNREFLANAISKLKVLQLTEEEIRDMMILEEYIPGKAWTGNKKERDTRFDVYAEIRGKRHIELEIQKALVGHDPKRVIYYFSKMVADRMKGDEVDDRDHISIWLFKEDISKAFKDLQGHTSLPIYTFTFANTKNEIGNVFSTDEEIRFSEGDKLILVNGGFDWSSITDMRPLTKDEEDVRNFILDMEETDKDNIRDGVSRKIMSDYLREGPNSRLIYEISQNLDAASLDLLRQTKEKAMEEGTIKTYAKTVLSVSSSFGVSIDEAILKLNIEPSLIPEVKKKIKEFHN